MRAAALLRLLAAAPPACVARPRYPAPEGWYPDSGKELLEYDFERWGATHTPEGQLQLRPEPMLEALGCLLGRITPRYGGAPTKTLALLIPKTGTRHLQTILDAEYGARQFMTRCRAAPVVHFAPRANSDMVAADWAVNESCKEEAAREVKRNEVVWSHVAAEMARQRLKMITVVREPMQYFLSVFSFRVGFDPSAESTIPELRRFIARPVLSANMQLGFLVRKRNCGQSCHMGHSADVTEEDLAAVLKMLDGGALLAGTCEQLGATVQMFHAELKWRTFDPETYGSFEPRTKGDDSKFRNGDVTSKKLRESDLTPELAADIRRLNELDQRLYDEVSRRLAEYRPPGVEL